MVATLSVPPHSRTRATCVDARPVFLARMLATCSPHARDPRHSTRLTLSARPSTLEHLASMSIARRCTRRTGASELIVQTCKHTYPPLGFLLLASCFLPLYNFLFPHIYIYTHNNITTCNCTNNSPTLQLSNSPRFALFTSLSFPPFLRLAVRFFIIMQLSFSCLDFLSGKV